MWQVAPESYSSTHLLLPSKGGVMTATAISPSSYNQLLSSMRASLSESNSSVSSSVAQQPSNPSSLAATVFADPTVSRMLYLLPLISYFKCHVTVGYFT